MALFFPRRFWAPDANLSSPFLSSAHQRAGPHLENKTRGTCLAQSVEHVTLDLSWDCEFKPHVECGGYLKKKKRLPVKKQKQNKTKLLKSQNSLTLNHTLQGQGVLAI